MTTSLGTTRAVTARVCATLALAAAATSAAVGLTTGSAHAVGTTEPPQVIAYAGGESPGATVHRSSQTRRLTGAPADFTRFIGRLADRLQADLSCDRAAIGVTVDFLRPDGYAVGSVSDCGGYQALWAKVDGRWKEIFGTQDAFDCRVLTRYAVPSSVVGDTCFNYGRNRERPYHQA